MTKAHLHLRIISSSNIEYDNEANMVIFPGVDGEFAVLPDHMNMISSLKEGVVKIHANGKIDTINIKGGIMSVSEGTKIDLLLG